MALSRVHRLKPERINSIIEDRNGTVWFTRSLGSDADGGLCQVIGTSIRCYGNADQLRGADNASALVEDTLGNLWIGNDTGAVRWKPGSSSRFMLKELKSKRGINGAKSLAVNVDDAPANQRIDLAFLYSIVDDVLAAHRELGPDGPPLPRCRGWLPFRARLPRRSCACHEYG